MKRSGYTILEVILVLAVLTILGAALIPTLSGLSRDTRSQTAADTVREMLAEGRSQAIERNHNYVFALSPDGKQLRIGADSTDMLNPIDEQNNAYLLRQDTLHSSVTIENFSEEAVTEEDGWTRVVTILPDGTCRENVAFLQISEEGAKPLFLQIRGLTATPIVMANPPGGISP